MMATRDGHGAQPTIRYAAGVGLAVAAAVLWAVGMTVLQPLTEPIGPWSETLPGNNTYWARDLRFLAILAVAAGLVLAGGRGAAVPAVLLAGGWLAVDVAVDRADLYGAAATVALAVAGCLAVAVTATVVRRPARADPDRPVLAATACVAAVLVLAAALTESPTDREPELDPAVLATGLLLLALTLACALAAAPPSPGTRRSDGSPLPATAERRRRYAIAAVIAVVGVVGLVLVRAVAPGQRLTPAAALGTVLLTGVTLLAWDWPDGRPTWWRHGLATLVAAVVPVVLLIAVAVVTGMLRLAAPLTALAGNSPINSADSDVLLSLSGLLAGLGTALLLARPAALGQAPAPPESPRRASADRR